MVRKYEKLSERQQQVYNMYYGKKLSQTEIAHRLNISQQAVSKLLRKINQKTGIIGLEKQGKKKAQNAKGVVTSSSQLSENKKYYRYHNLHFVIKPYYKTLRWGNNVGKVYTKGIWTIKVNGDNIELFSSRDITGGDIEACVQKLLLELNKIILHLENRLGCRIRKSDSLNVRLVRQHLAEVNSGVARQVNAPIRVEDDGGELRIVIDFSTGVPELETVHGVHAVDDMRELRRHLRAMTIHRDLPTIADQSRLMASSLELIQSLGMTVEQIVKYLGIEKR